MNQNHDCTIPSNYLPPLCYKSVTVSHFQKRNSNINRPSSNISLSNESDTSVLTDGTWAFSVNEGNESATDKISDTTSSVENHHRTNKKYQNAAVIGGMQVPVCSKSMLFFESSSWNLLLYSIAILGRAANTKSQNIRRNFISKCIRSMQY